MDHHSFARLASKIYEDVAWPAWLANPASWQEVVKAACKGDPKLFEKVERMTQQAIVAFNEKSFMQTGDVTLGREAMSLAISSETRLREIPSQIGDYSIIERLGAGGMGVVYLGKDVTANREVAIKVINPAALSERGKLLFIDECRAVAQVEHPGIARLFHVGETTEGQPYLVMEYVSRQNVLEYCDQNRLDIRRRLELFLQVCNAIQHVHRKPLVHRDIKPSNVLVRVIDDVPVTKVIDFGVAKSFQSSGSDTNSRFITPQAFQDHQESSSVRKIIGTPVYMSPEQAAGIDEDIDTLSDVYALGVLLCELLTGLRPNPVLAPFRQDGTSSSPSHPPRELPSTLLMDSRDALDLASLRATTPEKLASTLRSQLLDDIILKATHPAKSGRYTSPEALATDIRGYLTGNGVQGVDLTPGWYRTRKWCYRNRRIVMAAATIGVVIMVALIISLSALSRETDALKRETAARQKADASFDVALRMLEEFDPSNGIVIKTSTKIDSVATQVQQLAELDPLRAAPLLLQIASGYRIANSVDRAIATARLAVDCYRRVLPESDRKVLQARQSLLAYKSLGSMKLQELLPEYVEFLDECKRALSADDEIISNHAVVLSVAQMQAGQMDQARASLKSLIEQDLASPTLSIESRLMAYLWYGTSLMQLQEYDQAIELFSRVSPQARAAGLKLIRYYIEIENNIALAHRDAGRITQARAMYQEILPQAISDLGLPDSTTRSIAENLLATSIGTEINSKSFQTIVAVLQAWHDVHGPSVEGTKELAQALREWINQRPIDNKQVDQLLANIPQPDQGPEKE